MITLLQGSAALLGPFPPLSALHGTDFKTEDIKIQQFVLLA